MTKIEEIRNRRLSKRDEQAIASMAAKTGEPEKSESIEDQMPQPPQAKNNPPNSIEEIAKHYFISFREDQDIPTACALTQAAMQLEGAALIAKAIREK